jgi:hypothetical protein
VKLVSESWKGRGERGNVLIRRIVGDLELKGGAILRTAGDVLMELVIQSRLCLQEGRFIEAGGERMKARVSLVLLVLVVCNVDGNLMIKDSLP